MKFKKLELKPQGPWWKRMLQSKHIQKSVLFILIGALAGFLFYYITEGSDAPSFVLRNMVDNIIVGAFFGWFITNNPCAQNRC